MTPEDLKFENEELTLENRLMETEYEQMARENERLELENTRMRPIVLAALLWHMAELNEGLCMMEMRAAEEAQNETVLARCDLIQAIEDYRKAVKS